LHWFNWVKQNTKRKNKWAVILFCKTCLGSVAVWIRIGSFVWIVFARDTDFDDVFTIAIINPVFFFIFMLCSELRIQAELLVEYQGYEWELYCFLRDAESVIRMINLMFAVQFLNIARNPWFTKICVMFWICDWLYYSFIVMTVICD